MGTYLFNILTLAQGIKDFVLNEGPQILDDAATVADQVANLFRRTSEYISQFGSSTQIAAGQGARFQGGVDNKDAQNYLSQLQAIRAEVAGHMDKVEKQAVAHDEQIQKQLGAGVNAGLLDWLGKVDPNTKKFIGSLLLSLLDKVLNKSGINPTAPSGATKSSKKADK